ncbi:hypothetical protein J2T58_001988 [Methanocalculus alkaliphilus]|uniref:hypothetical protein n=1 Tax=Methanocalculus alkaliphilus TaxID=768730 RepID=UPI0020A15EA9|nr:hypothetical protein [Methanocalculus alkaliphilus]MCP1716113.1 hypothetical protein [Methanocalculus alkaliphilus]
MSVWMFFIILFMILTEAPSIEILFALTLLGMLLIADITTPSHVRPTFLKGLNIIIATGVVIFALYFIQAIMEVIGV